MTCEKSVDLGAYLLGALAPEERRAMERHIAGCAECRAELVALAPLPGLLRHTPFEEMPDTARAAEEMRPTGPPWTGSPGPGEPGREARGPDGPDFPGREFPGDSAPGPGLPDEAQGESASPGGGYLTAGGGPGRQPAAPEPAPPRGAGTGGPSGHRRPRGRRRVLVAAGLALAAAAAGVGLTLGVQRTLRPAGTPAAVTESLRATDPVSHVSATADLTSKAWGTQVDLSLGNLPPGITCHLVVRAKDGRSETAGTWTSGYGYDAGSGSHPGSGVSVPASTSVRPQDIAWLDIVSSSGRTLVAMRG